MLGVKQNKVHKDRKKRASLHTFSRCMLCKVKDTGTEEIKNKHFFQKLNILHLWKQCYSNISSCCSEAGNSLSKYSTQGKKFFSCQSTFSQTRLKLPAPSSFLKRRFPLSRAEQMVHNNSRGNTWSQHIPLAVSRLIRHAHYPPVLSNKQCSAHTHTRQRATLIIQCGAEVFFPPPLLA